MVSYPMLIGSDGKGRADASKWLANRSFVAQDVDGYIVLGTTVDAFFSLDKLADFLRQSPLKLKTALNLDGGWRVRGFRWAGLCGTIAAGLKREMLTDAWRSWRRCSVKGDGRCRLCWQCFQNNLRGQFVSLELRPDPP